MTCRKCQFLGVTPNAAGKVSPRKGNAYPCYAPIPEPPPLPASVMRSNWGFSWPPKKNWMEPDDGENCPTFEARA
jgi:hypothetical protein